MIALFKENSKFNATAHRNRHIYALQREITITTVSSTAVGD